MKDENKELNYIDMIDLLNISSLLFLFSTNVLFFLFIIL